MEQLVYQEMWKLLPKVGLNPLSMEGCNFGTRWDCDISPAAKDLVEEYFGGIRLTHTGYNGWSLDPTGKFHAGYSAAYHYVDGKRTKMALWETFDGSCFKLPSSVIPELFCFLALRQGMADVIGYLHVQNNIYDGFHFQGEFLLFNNGEYRIYREAFDEYWQLFVEAKQNATGFPEQPQATDHIENVAWFGAKWTVEGVFDNTFFYANHASANRHFMSGKLIA